MTGILTKSTVAVSLTANLGFAASSVYLIYLDGVFRALGIVGLFLGIYITWHFKHKADKREEEADKRAQELHKKEMEPKDEP